MAILPPPFDLEGLKVWTTLQTSKAQKILTWSDATLSQAVDGLTGLYVIDSATEKYIRSVQRQLDTVGNDYSQKAIHFAASKPSLELLANILHLGADPDVMNGDGHTVAQRCSQNGCAVVAEDISACRPDLTIVKSGGSLEGGLVLTNQLQYALWYEDYWKYPVLDVADIWRKAMSHGFPSLAQLAYDKKWSAVHNLCRRRVISDEEKNKKYKGKTAVEWAQVHGQDMVVKEMTYLLELDDRGKKDEGQGSDEVAEIREMLLLTITKGNEEKEEIQQEVAALKIENADMKKETDTLRKSVDSLSAELKEMKELKTENEDMKKEMDTLKKSVDFLSVELKEMKKLKQGVPKRSSMGPAGGPQQQQMVTNLSVDKPKLQRDPNAWKPGMVIDTAETTEQAELYKKVRGILNKLTPQTFDALVGQVKELEITELPVLLKVIDMVFEKACDEPGFPTAYARMCHELSTKMRVQTEDGQEVYFRKALLMKCQREFEAECLYYENRDEKRIKSFFAETDEKREELQLDLEDKDRKMKKRYLGTVRFIGELFIMSMLTVQIMHKCVAKLLSGWHGMMHEDSLECLCELLTIIGAKMEDTSQFAGASKNASVIPDHQEKMKNYFNQMQSIVEAKDTSSRVRFMLLDTIDLRANNWVPRREIAGPKTIDQIYKEAEAEEAKKHIAIIEAKARQREKDREARDCPRDRANMGLGSRGSRQGQQQDDWVRVEATKKHERQNQMYRKNFDPSRLQSMTIPRGAMSFGPQGGGSFWKSGSGAGGGA